MDKVMMNVIFRKKSNASSHDDANSDGGGMGGG